MKPVLFCWTGGVAAVPAPVCMSCFQGSAGLWGLTSGDVLLRMTDTSRIAALAAAQQCLIAHQMPHSRPESCVLPVTC